jgi:hypothetical protein
MKMRNNPDVELRRPDSAGRITIGKENKDKLYAVQPQPNGDILLSPVVIRHEREAWLYENKEVMESVLRGLEQSAHGETHDLGSFAQYADVEAE